MKKLLLASVLAIASFPGYAATQERANWYAERGITVPKTPAEDKCEEDYFGDDHPSTQEKAEYEACIKRARAAESDLPEKPPARVTVAPPYQGPPPIGWVYGPYTQCANPPQCSMGVVSVAADGLNVRVTPNGPPIMALVNGTPLYPVRREGPWLLVATGCDLTPTFAWSWTAGVPLNRCWVYY